MFIERRLWILQIWFKISVLVFSSCCIAMACNFDEISFNAGEVPVTTINYASKVAKREIHYPYAPLRIHLHFGLSEIDLIASEAIKDVLRMAVSTISQLLEVIPVSGPLLLDRLSCAKKWNHGVNKGLCSDLYKYYKGEFCENKIDLFKIPAQHLANLSVYDMSSSSPIYSLPSGQGVSDADFIMYVISHVSDFCLHQDVQAYASYCRLDQNGRPVAGFMNFCPNSIEEGLLNKKRMFHVAVHEIFHSLGFSKDLFHKYRSCDLDSRNCTSVKHMIIKDSHGLYRLNLPTVVEQMRKHFNCSDDVFGAPLEAKEGADLYGSHWDPLIMYGSIMAPTVSQPEFTSIDPITLSVFADTGWYKVNFSNADKYLWGKGKGCNFGFEENCGTGTYPELCNTKTQNHSSGCDFWQHTISWCQTIEQNKSCGLFKPNMEDQCLLKKPDKATGVTSKNMRCFLTKEKNKVQPICTVFRCSLHELNIWYNNTWHICPSESKIVVDETVLMCPQKDSLCHSIYKKHPHPSDRHAFLPAYYDSSECVISLKFDEPTPQTVMQLPTLEHFKVAAIEAIAKALSVPLEWIVNTLLTVIENIVLTVYIDPPEKTSPSEIRQLVEDVQKFLRQETFSFIFFEDGNAIVAVSLDITVNKELELRTYDIKGYILFGVLLSTSVFFAVAAAVPVFKKCIIQKRRQVQSMVMSQVPKNENGELSDITVES